MRERLEIFLNEYSQGDAKFLYCVEEVSQKIEKRLTTLADWTENFAKESDKPELKKDAKMCRMHAKWIVENFR